MTDVTGAQELLNIAISLAADVASGVRKRMGAENWLSANQVGVRVSSSAQLGLPA